MRIYRFSISLVFVTSVALLYVHQQVGLLKVSYKINSNEKEFTRLLDRNRALIYNVTRLKSPVTLEKKFLADKKDYTISVSSQIVKIAAPRGEAKMVMLAKKEKSPLGIFKIFGRPREAMANTIK
jgi:hypothetical protein